MRFPPAAIAACLLLSAPAARAEPRPAAHPKVDQARVDAAVDQAGRFLLQKLKEGKLSVWQWGDATSAATRADEFVLYTLLHCGVPRNHPDFEKALQRCLARDHIDVYRTSVLAMLLAALDPEKYQSQLALCAQFLVDAQCENGQWAYPGPKLETPELTPDAAAPAESKPASGGTKALKRVPIKRKQKGPSPGNNSTTQIALLGLRACAEAEVRAPAETFALAEQWWRKNQNTDGGWGYGDKGGGGWSYGSMTAGAVGSLAICDHFLRKDPKQDREIVKGVKWLEDKDNWTLDNNPKHPKLYHHYWFYALERAGMLVGIEKMGSREWYPEGAEWLLTKQNKDGSWHETKWVEDTCYAVLFLRRATRPLPKMLTR